MSVVNEKIDPTRIPGADSPSGWPSDRAPGSRTKHPSQPVIDPEDPKTRHEKPGKDSPRGPQDLPGEKL